MPGLCDCNDDRKAILKFQCLAYWSLIRIGFFHLHWKLTLNSSRLIIRQKQFFNFSKFHIFLYTCIHYKVELCAPIKIKDNCTNGQWVLLPFKNLVKHTSFSYIFAYIHMDIERVFFKLQFWIIWIQNVNVVRQYLSYQHLVNWFQYVFTISSIV
jgi:hypothetical protein